MGVAAKTCRHLQRKHINDLNAAMQSRGGAWLIAFEASASRRPKHHNFTNGADAGFREQVVCHGLELSKGLLEAINHRCKKRQIEGFDGVAH